MKSKKNRSCIKPSVFFTVALMCIFSLLFVGGFESLADDSSDFQCTEGTGDEVVVSGYTGEKQEIVIPDELNGKKVSGISMGLDIKKTNMVIPATVSSIRLTSYGNKLVIFGDSNSAAETFAENKKLVFIPLGDNPFSDVKNGKFYYKPVLWAYKTGVTAGVSEDIFAPGNVCTRGQVVTFLWRMAGSPTPKDENSPFVDVKINAKGKKPYYYDAVLWAVENQITSGKDSTHFAPNENCTRSQFVSFLYRASGEPDFSDIKNPFKDVKAGVYYEKSVLWAYSSGITSGVSENEFAPKSNVTRGQVASFLYRHSCISDELITEGSPKITIDSVTAKAGTKGVKVNALIENNPGVLGATLSVYYNEDYLSLVSVTNGTAFSPALTFTKANILRSGCNLVWDGQEITDQDMKDGTIVTFEFDVADDIPDGVYQVVVSYTEGDVIDRNLKPVSVEIKNGSLVVER